MNFDLPEEIRMLKDTVRKFVDREMIPIERTGRDGHKLKPEVRADLETKAKELGLTGYDVPQEYGGLGMGLVAKVSRCGPSLPAASRCRRAAATCSARRSARSSITSTRSRRRSTCCRPSAGKSNGAWRRPSPTPAATPARMRTTAVRQGDHYVINGMKRFITGADEADFAQLIAATDRTKGSHGGISAFIVDMKSPGVKLLRPQELVIDDRPWEIAFENVKVPVENRIGEEGDGFKHAQNWINLGRLRHGARGIGVIERCLELGAGYAKQRVTFGQPLAERQAVQWMLVDSYMELHQLRLMVYDAAWKYDQGRDIRTEAYMAKIFGDTQSFLAADRCMEIHGGMGLATDLPIEKMWRDQRSMMITEGPIEILKMTLARHVLRTYG